MPATDLQTELAEIAAQLSDPVIASDYKRAGTLAKRYAEIERLLRPAVAGADGQGQPQELIMEIRAGAGGEEAALFAARLFNMYQTFALQQGWSSQLLDGNQTTLGGYKQVVFE